MTAPNPLVEIYADADDLAAHVAAATVGLLSDALAARSEAHLALTGGGILEAVMRAIRTHRDELDWSRVHVWWGDERFVPKDSDDRNDKAAFAALLDHLPLDPARIHPMPAADEGEPDVDAAARRYADELAAAAEGDGAVPAFDVILLGVGPDGHCASLFPHHPGLERRDTAAIGVHDSPKPPPLRISLTFPALDAARQVWFVASGDGKADAVAKAVGGNDVHDTPSAGPRGRDRTLWLVDQAAAAQLPASR